MDMTWRGHACFRMRGREGIVLTDPPDPKSGHAIPRTEAGLVTMSHEHAGHASLKPVAADPAALLGPAEYEGHEVLVTGIGTVHDDQKKATPYQRLLHELGVKELVPVPKLSVTRSTLPENLQVVALDSRAR